MAIRPDTLGIVVKDMGKALAFYRLLGLAIPQEEDTAPHVEVTIDNGYSLGFDIEAVARDANPQWEEPRGQRLTLAFHCDSPAEVDATYAALAAAGYPGLKEPWDAFWGQRYAFLRDADNNRVDIFADLPDA